MAWIPKRRSKGAPVSLFVANIHPDDTSRVDQEIRSAVTAGAGFSSEYRLVQADGSFCRVLARGYCLLESGRAVRFPGATIDITERKAAELHRELLTDELNHRVKNTLATVQAIAAQSFKSGAPAARDAFIARLKSISNAHDLLTGERWAGAGSGLPSLTQPSTGTPRAGPAIRGPNIRLSPSSALALSMAINELSTNAVKYGASLWSMGVAWSYPLGGE